GDSALSFELQIWTRDPRSQFQLISDLNYRIEANLRRLRIAVPFPQRDLHLRTPQLEQLLGALARRHFSAAELAAGNGHDATDQPADETAPPPETFDGDLCRRVWADDEIRALATRLRGPDGVLIADRRHLLTVYRQCFIGREAVDWLTRTCGLTRA